MYKRSRGRKRWIGGLFRASRFASRFISRRTRNYPIFNSRKRKALYQRRR